MCLHFLNVEKISLPALTRQGNPQGSIESEKISRQHVIDVLCDVVGAHSNLQIDNTTYVLRQLGFQVTE